MRDIDEIRRDNMRRIEQEVGGPTAAGTPISMTVTQWSNLRDGAKDSKTGKPRGMRKETARKIENGHNKPPGWLDTDHSGGDAATAENPPWPAYERADEAQQALVNAILGVGKAPSWVSLQTVDFLVGSTRKAADDWHEAERKKANRAA